MIPGTDLHCFDVHNDGYFSHLPFTYVNGVILEMVVRRMPYEQFAEYLKEKSGNYFQGLYYQVPNQDLERGLVRVSDDRLLSYMFDVEETFGRLNLYLDHLDMNLSEYLSQAITYEMDACVSKIIGPPKKRFYVCFVGLADKLKAGCRKIIALDGCFLKSLNQGEILTAIGKDANNHTYPVAWAVVNVKNKDNWTWFLELLVEDLGSSRGNRLTLMSDQHKVLWKLLKMSCQMLSTGNVQDIFMKTLGNNTLEIGLAEGTTKVFSPSMLLVLDKLFRLTLITNNCIFWHVIPAGENLFEVRLGSEGFTVDEGKRTCSCRMWQLSGIHCVHATKPDQSMYSTVLPPKPRKMPGRPRKKRIKAIVEQIPQPKGVPGRPRKKQSVGDLEDVDVVLRGPVRDEGAGGSRGGASGSRGRGGAGGSRGGAGGSRGGASGSRGGASGSRGGASGSRGGASVSREGVGGSRGGASGSKRKPVSSKPVQTQDEDQVVQTQKQAKIDLTQVEQTQEQTQDQVQPQEQPQQVTSKRPSARILQKKLEKQDSSQNTALNVE
ncbi:multidrug resistance-associated protein 5 [Tanacetum coccineum]|uniref:Multidrug resistance-associated protein 5 n=1 Tax=Tanacetum coccineum TaxID=301880 RepID=A0ABQ4ZYD0_9ASTR